MYTLINGSPKNKSSNSRYFLDYISKYLYDYKLHDLKITNYLEILKDIDNSLGVVLAFPLYLDSPNSVTLAFLDYIFDKKIDLNNKRIYFIINCGFRESEHNLTAINIMKSWCLRVNARYSGAVLIGAGEIVGKKKYRFLSNKTFKILREFSDVIANDKETSEYITTLDLLNNKLYCKIINYLWNKKAKLNNLDKEAIMAK